MENRFCINHPHTPSRFRCFHCKKSICTECRRHLQHHFFCSYSCSLKFTTVQSLKYIKRYQLQLIAITQLILVVAFLGNILYYQHRFEQLASVLPISTESSVSPDLSDFLKVYLEYGEHTPFSQAGEQSHPAFQLSIPMEADWVANIWKNSRPVLSHLGNKKGPLTCSISLDYGENLIRVMVLDTHQKVVYKDQISVIYRNSRVELFRHSIERGNRTRKNMAVTFDAGSDDAYTREILSLLQTFDLKCTLFLTGKFMKEYPDLVKKMLERGHEIANHTYDHPHLTTWGDNGEHQILPSITREFLHRQLLKTDSVYFTITGQHLKPFWRAPYGEYNHQILTWAAELGYLHIQWTGSFDTHDWVTDKSSQLYRTPGEVFDQIMRAESDSPQGLNGVIMLMHLASQRTDNHMFEILPRLIPAIRDKGYTPGVVSDILN